MDKNFSQFKKEFKKYQDRFELNNYKVYYAHCPLDSFAEITISQVDMVATVRLTSKLDGLDKKVFNPKKHAKHEALHLLIGRLESNGRHRYISNDEMYEATEELARKLDRLIKD